MSEPPQGSRGHPYRAARESPRQEPKQRFLWGWILAPLAVLGMAYMLQHTSPAVTWTQIMDLLHVHNRERYTMLFHLCLALILVVATVRILRHRT